jgi:hypothetical protein
MEHIERCKNSEAEDLAKVVAHNMPLPTDVFFQIILDASIKTVEPEPRIINIIEGEDWRTPIMAYLNHYYEPDTTTEHTRMHRRAKVYQIVGNKLYKTSASGPLLCCISKAEGQELLLEIHTGICRGGTLV